VPARKPKSGAIKASRDFSTAMGVGTTASGGHSTAMGNYSIGCGEGEDEKLTADINRAKDM
jgi:hypothetical protein